MTKLLSWISLFLIFSSLQAKEAFDPEMLYLTWQHSPETTMTVQWISPTKDTQEFIEYQKEGSGGLWFIQSGLHRAVPNEQELMIHSVELTGLSPDANYAFRFNAEGKEYKFRTMPSSLNRPLHFVVGGDVYHGYLDHVEKTNLQAAKTSPLFALIGGDIVYSFGKFSKGWEVNQRWYDWLKLWKKSMVTPEGFLIPIIPAIGNHEVMGNQDQTPEEAPFFYAAFPMPGLQGYNVLDFGQYMSIIMLDSDHTHPIIGTQTEWLKKTLEERKEIPNKFVFYHVAAFPSVREFNSSISTKMRQYWSPLFEENHVSAVFEHNDHAYKRTYPIRQGKAHPEGVIYLGDGAWGVKKSRRPKLARWSWYLAKTAQTRHFINVTIEPSYRYYEAIDPNGFLIDSYRQQYSLEKSEELKCVNY